MSGAITRATQLSFDPAEFAGKRVLITGGTKGMGEAIVRRLSAGGARVATTARSPLPEGQSVELFVQADISTPDGVGKVVKGVLDRLGGLDILVNNAGGSDAPSGGVLVLTDDDWRRALDMNLLAAVRGDGRLCGGESCADDLQQGAVERSRSERGSRQHGGSWLHRDDGSTWAHRPSRRGGR